MRNFSLFAVIALLGAGLFISGCATGPVNYNTKEGCFQKAYSKYSYQQVSVPGSEARKYADEVWDECRCKYNGNDIVTAGDNFGKKYTDVYNVNPDCSRFKK